MRGSEGRQPEFEQPNWTADTVINARQVHLSGSRGSPAQELPPPADGPGFRTSLARLLLRKLTSTLHEMYWLDDALVDLSVTVEDVDGRPVTRRRRPWSPRRGDHAIRPLSDVLARPETDLILLQGEAGAGKSVALRQHARSLLEQIAEGRDTTAPLPFYVNLRELRVGPDEINTALLRQYILEQTSPHGSADVAAYFAHYFMDDLRHQRVTLLLDSFDEVPAVYGSATIDEAVSPYVQTVIELVGGGGRCVVAAREYKGPRAAGWSRLQLLGLSSRQQEDFLLRLRLDTSHLALVRPLLTDPRRGFTTVLRNPLHLRLLASYVQARNALPDRPSRLFAEYAALRLREALPTPGARAGSAEPSAALRGQLEGFLAGFAFRLTATGEGLSVPERRFRDEVVEAAGGETASAEAMIHALYRSRILCTSEAQPSAYGRRQVFFGHRRVLEYFASRYVTERSSAVPPGELATNRQWRETAVAVLQDGSPDVARPLVEALCEQLARERARAEAAGFEWSSEAVHCLELLTTAYQGRTEWPRGAVQPLVEELVATAWDKGSISDRKFALDCLPLLPEPSRQAYIDRAFEGDSNWIRRTALRDCATLSVLTPEVQASIRRLLISRLGEPPSSAETHALDVDLQRLRTEDDLVALRRLLDRIPRLMLWSFGIGTVLASLVTVTEGWWILQLAMAMCLAPGTFWIFQSTRPLSYGHGTGLPHRILDEILSEEWETRELLGFLTWWTACLTVPGTLTAVRAISDGRISDGLPAGVCSLALAEALLWGPSVLYTVHRGGHSRKLDAKGLLLVVPRVLALADHPARAAVRALVRKFSWRAATATLLVMGLVAGSIGGASLLISFLLRLTGPVQLPQWLSTALPIALPASLTLWGLWRLCRYIVSTVTRLARANRRRRRLNQAVEQGSVGGTAFLSALFSLEGADEAADYVLRVRTARPGSQLGLDRATLRLCIASLQGRTPEGGPGIPAEDLARLTDWKEPTRLLDELGRLDEELRPR
ncbi:NACHT domain-containing protein [Streptomyces sp. NPDC057257]|uniref:NACHT domain-containing protein n=1 Tax=Streptomyces sp. NPDC057257 TaxID=3346071 RepID=UPI003624B5C5